MKQSNVIKGTLAVVALVAALVVGVAVHMHSVGSPTAGHSTQNTAKTATETTAKTAESITADYPGYSSVEEGVKAALESKAEIVVVCASDDDYAEAAPKVKELLGDKAILVVAGAPACMPELEAQGIKNFINVKSNVLETLKFYLKEMGI